MISARYGEVSIHIDAPAERVWSLLSHLDRMGDWSPECYRVRWLDGATSPAVPGSRFRGSNKFRWIRWSMTCEVKTALPGRELIFSTLRGTRECVRWRYLLETTASGTDLTESFEVLWLPLEARIFEDHLMVDRDRRREQSMRTTLERIKSLAESDERSATAADRRER